jgi:hypothetical protein
MSLKLKASSGKKDFGQMQPDNYPARLVQIIDLGMQAQVDYTTGEPKDSKNRAILTFEFPTERIEVREEDRPRWLSREFTLSNHELAGIMQVVGALDSKWDAEEQSISDLLGKPCQITTGLTSGKKAKILSVSKIGKGMKVGELENPASFFDFDDPNIDLFKTFPQWIRDKIKEAENYEGSTLETKLAINDEDFDEDIPF